MNLPTGETKKHTRKTHMNATAQIKAATKQLVDSLLEMNTNNRPLRKSVVDCYKQDIADGRWYITNQGIGVSADGVLIDGQHRLEALKQMGYPPVPLLIVSGLPREAQEVVDQHAKRGARDVWKLIFNSVVADAAPAICNIIHRSRNAWSGGRVSNQRLKDILDEHVDEIAFVLEQAGSAKFFAAPYLAAFVVVAKEQPEAQGRIAEFMERVAAGENLSRNMPEFHLRNVVITSKGTRGGQSLQEERFAKTCKALRAALAGQEIKILRAAA
jgi:hypothetical protein